MQVLTDDGGFSGAIRLRFDRGWTSKFASSGDPLVVSVSAEELESEATTTVSSQAAASQRSESSQWDQDVRFVLS
jgi:hypothetical protein